MTNLWVTRQALGLSQRAAAKVLGIDQPTYCRLETGRKQPTAGVVRRVQASEAPQMLKDAVLGVVEAAAAVEA